MKAVSLYVGFSEPLYCSTHNMEKITIRACDYNFCPSTTLTGNNVAKIALAIMSVVVLVCAVRKLS